MPLLAAALKPLSTRKCYVVMLALVQLHRGLYEIW